MRNKMERLVFLPLAIGCMSESSVTVASPTQNEPSWKDDPSRLMMMGREMQKREREDCCSSDDSTKNSFGFVPVPKPNISAGIHRLFKGLKSFSQLFAYKENMEEEEEEIEIGAPTDVKHVTHIGWDGCNAMNDIFGSPLSSLPFLPLESQEVQTLSC